MDKAIPKNCLPLAENKGFIQSLSVNCYHWVVREGPVFVYMNTNMTISSAVSNPENNRNRTVKRLALMATLAFLLRLMITPYINELMNPEHILCWEQGNVAAALVQGHGFGSPFDQHFQPSAVMPPIFPLIVAAIFKIFGVRTVASVYAVHTFDCLVSALAIFPIFLVAALAARLAGGRPGHGSFRPMAFILPPNGPGPRICCCWLFAGCFI